MHVPVLHQTGACCHGAAAFDKRRHRRRMRQCVIFDAFSSPEPLSTPAIQVRGRLSLEKRF
jgi:hypothetical protein